MAICCNRRGGVNSTPHTSPFLSLIHTHTRGSSRKFGVCTSHSMRHLHALMLCVWFLRGLMTWRVMPRNAWNDIVSWQTRPLNNFTKYQLHALMTIISKKKNWNPWETCQNHAVKLFWNACTWHVLEDLIFYGQRTNLHDRSQNGPKLVTNDYLVWSLTFVIHVTTDNIVMWETLHNNAGWDCFRTLILPEILRTQNQPQEVSCAFWEAEHLSQSAGCARDKLLSRTVLHSLRLFLWMPDCVWMGCLLSNLWDILIEVQPKHTSHLSLWQAMQRKDPQLLTAGVGSAEWRPMKQYTTNLCQKCFCKHLQEKRRRTTDKCDVEAGCGKEGVSWKNVENDGERAVSARDVGTFLQWKIEGRDIFDNWPTRKGRREHKVSGSRNRQPETQTATNQWWRKASPRSRMRHGKSIQKLSRKRWKPQNGLLTG